MSISSMILAVVGLFAILTGAFLVLFFIPPLVRVMQVVAVLIDVVVAVTLLYYWIEHMRKPKSK